MSEYRKLDDTAKAKAAHQQEVKGLYEETRA
jgi:hypothetical protein